MRRLKKNEYELVSRVLMFGMVGCIFLAIVGALGTDIYLASTQWMLLGAVLGILGVYLRMEK